MSGLLTQYASVVGEDVIEQIQGLARPLAGLRVIHVNSTRVGGGVAEILTKLVPFMQELGLEASWEVITGEEEFFACTKTFHNALQGFSVHPTESQLQAYEATNARNAEIVGPTSGFDDSSLEAARRWEFRPAQYNRRNVPARSYLLFVFRQPVT